MVRIASLFCGIGGCDIAFRNLGIETTWANDNNRYAIQTYRENFQNVDIADKSISNIPSAEIPDVDILLAGFPCQSFSVMGYQLGFSDPRGNLFFEIARILKDKEPKIIILENVRNLLNHDNGNTFKIIHDILSGLGYYVKYKVMSPHEYANIPQIRERIFIVAFKNGAASEKFEFPNQVALTQTVSDIIDKTQKHHFSYYYCVSNKYYPLLEARVKDKNAIYRIDDWGIASKRWSICPTLKANMGTYHDRVPIIRDNFGIRKITPYECLAFQGFPKSYKFPAMPRNEAYKQCGNTVCVDLVEKIGRGVLELL